MAPALQIHGSIIYLLKKYVERNLTAGSWYRLSREAGLENLVVDPHDNYDLTVLATLRNVIAREMRLSANELYEKLGEFLVPDLLDIFRAHVNPSWNTYQLLENAEFVMHKAVRNQENKADPPVLNVSRVHDQLLIIDYYSKRRMASLAIGIIRGIAAHYKENIRIVPTTNANDERVQIRIEFGVAVA
jgi:hypothetical protein